MLCILSSAALLQVRILVIFRDNKFILLPTFGLLVAFLIAGALVTAGLKPINLPNSSGCSYTSMPSFSFLPYLIQAAYDVLVFVLCTWKLLATNTVSFSDFRCRKSTMKITYAFFNAGALRITRNLWKFNQRNRQRVNLDFMSGQFASFSHGRAVYAAQPVARSSGQTSTSPCWSIKSPGRTLKPSCKNSTAVHKDEMQLNGV
ncbi:hypothetical protein BKA65DRAFT_540140 [Rhexocercosporidium sp. MPI-PUGE-AT-0058]|nr:hypothetical protein BKA65DRAFT_540140 [Rhexocercosporidium sp. MPI-PUGE-AT-0058]